MLDQLRMSDDVRERCLDFDWWQQTGPAFGRVPKASPSFIDLFPKVRETNTGDADQRRLLPRGSGRIVLYLELQGDSTLYDEVSEAIATAQATAPSEPTLYSSVADAIQATRRSTDLPVDQVAQMFGIKRRGLYKILEEDRTSKGTESRIYAVANFVHQLEERFGAPTMVRAALLTPLSRLDNRAFVDVAGELDLADLRMITDAFLDDEVARTMEERSKRDAPLIRDSSRISKMTRARADAE